MVALIALVVGCASRDGTPTVTGATDRAPVRLPDFDGPGELERAVTSDPDTYDPDSSKTLHVLNVVPLDP